MLSGRIPRAALGVFFIAILLIAFGELRERYVYADLLRIARQADARGGISPETIRDQVVYARRIPQDRICKSDFLKAGAVILLQDLDLQNPDENYEDWASAISSVEIFLIHSLRCSPSDGNMWLRLAMVRQQIAEQPMEVARLLKLSQHYAPAEAGILKARMRFWNKLSPASLVAARATLEIDMRIICEDKTKLTYHSLPQPSKAMRSALSSNMAVQNGTWCRK